MKRFVVVQKLITKSGKEKDVVVSRKFDSEEAANIFLRACRRPTAPSPNNVYAVKVTG